jgi:hypothetical protein
MAAMTTNWKPLLDREAEREKQIERIQEMCRYAAHWLGPSCNPVECPRCALEWVLRDVFGVTPWSD